MRLPLLDRLGLRDYLNICFTLCAFCLECSLRLLFSVVLPFTPRFVEEWFRKLIALLLQTKPGSEKPRKNDRDSVKSILDYWGYPYDSYVAPTKDGYLLGLHRIPFGKTAVSREAGSKPVVLLWHGFMMNSEVWVCSNDCERILPFVLADLGYDVWLGNTRGNKYSCKHVSRKPNSIEFWDFSIDELVLYDLPAAVDHILQTTGAPSLTYVGFSQATAQCFGALSLYTDLNRKINLFIALAPATRPKDLRNGMIQAFIKASPNVIYLFLGRKRALSATLFWQSVLPRTAYVRIIDMCVHFLFGWGNGCMSFEDRATCYRHLYSFTSVKNVVHWFQIIRTGFAMYDETSPILPSGVGGKLGHVAHAFPTRHIRAPIAIMYGGTDSLVDVDMLLSDLPKPVFLKEVRDYEHLSFLWAQGIEKQVYPDIIDLLTKYQVFPPANGQTLTPGHLENGKSIQLENQAVNLGRITDE